VNSSAGRSHWIIREVLFIIVAALLGMALFVAFVVCVLTYDGFFVD
jgi:hypothetical protein